MTALGGPAVTAPGEPAVTAWGSCRTTHGQTSLLVVGFAVVVAMLVALVVDASAAYLRRQSLAALADGAALAAADGVQGHQVYEHGLGERALIDPAVAESYVADYLASVRAGARYPGLRYTVATQADAVVVRVTAPVELPLTPPGWESRAVVTGTAAAYVVVTD